MKMPRSGLKAAVARLVYCSYDVVQGETMSNLMELQSQIEKLQKQASEVKAREYASTIQDILAKMKAFDITIKDLQSAKPASSVKSPKTGKGKSAERKAAKVGKTPGKAARPVAAKYRGPAGETWSGRGLTPKWLAALIAQGQSKESFEIRA